jgi:Sulfotransferase family
MWRRATRRAFRPLSLDVGGGPSATVVLAGSGRSGTTWLAELLTRSNAFRYLFEPLHPDRTATLGLAPRPYLRPSETDPRLTAPVEAMLSGRARGHWVDQYNRKALARRRLVKDVWANLALGWVGAQHPETKILFILRHPLAVAESQMATGWEWWTDPALLLGQPELVEDHLEPWRGLLEGLDDPFRRHVATWCVENAVPLAQLAPGGVHVACYEHLLDAPERKLPPLFAFAGVRWDERVLSAAARPSSVSRGGPGQPTGGRPGEAWRSAFSADQVRWTMSMLSAFGLDRIYGEGRRPVISDAGSQLRPATREGGPVSTR